ncbi:TetR family transcriptional regulator BioQ [Microbacterium pseudoresistens]|uniref:AcrR family transcriptional regulator n=1 Tax=Microbacterium pseudoresistens TaxID=640634 RepID=A0A7Y9JNI9_9MICO|nr:TetR family transcriptional regulator [Microbacterium pseudoresistens]NYD55375.1 AcrR family transcriptional regulator [Microbacterium pseudoresistens]
MTPPRTARHDRGHVVDVALELLDRVGLPDLTMRRLAAELDVQPSALYWHVASKQELLAAVADRILDRTPPSPDDGVPAAARSIRDALLAYRDGAEVVMSSYALGLGARHAYDVLAGALRRAGIPDVDASAAVLLQFVLGHTLVVQQRMHAESHGAAGVDGGWIESARSDAAIFDHGVRALVALPAR